MTRPILAGAALLAVAIALAPAQATETVTYTYDERGRLITSSSTGVATPSLSIAGASTTEGGNLAFVVTGAGKQARSG